MTAPVLFLYDVESTGLLPEDGDEIFQLACLVHRLGSPVDDVLVDAGYCDPGRPISEGAKQITGCDDALVKGKTPVGEFVKNMWKSVKEYADGATIIPCGHNTQFDRRFITKHIPDFPTHDICTLRTAYRKLPYALNRKLAPLYQDLIDKPVLALLRERDLKAHDALNDIYMTYELLHYFTNGDYLSELEIQKTPTRLDFMPMGKNKGKRFDELETSTLKWFASEPQMQIDVKYSAKCILDDRSGRD